MFSLTIIIPAYNAGATLEDVIRRIPPGAWEHLQGIFIINDGSTDNTPHVIESLKETYHQVFSHAHETNQGYGRSLKTGLKAALKNPTDYLICLHADGQYAPECIPEFIEAASARSLDILQGSRHKAGGALKGGMPLYKFIAGKVLSRLESAVFQLGLSDFHSGYLCYSRKALACLPFNHFSDSFDFDLEVIASARKSNLTVGEIPIPTRYAGEVSHLNPLTYGLRVLGVLWRYVFMPGRYLKQEAANRKSEIRNQKPEDGR